MDCPFKGVTIVAIGDLNHATTLIEEIGSGSELPDREVVFREKEFFQGDEVPLEDVLPSRGPTSYAKMSLGEQSEHPFVYPVLMKTSTNGCTQLNMIHHVLKRSRKAIQQARHLRGTLFLHSFLLLFCFGL